MIGFIGAGKVGFSLGKLFEISKFPVRGYYSRNIDSAKQAAAFTHSSVFTDLETLVNECDIIFITVPDGMIKSVYEEISIYDLSDKQLCHCSGSLTADEIFEGLAQRGGYGYSIHPLFPVSSKYESYKDLSKAFFSIEGDEVYLDEWKDRLEKMGARVRIIGKDDKVKYHAACAIASNLVCGLLGESLRLLEECGFSQEEGRAALSPLAFANMKKILEVGAAQALTGPLERGDEETIKKHLECLDSNAEREMYKSLSTLLLREARVKNPTRDYSGVEKLL